MSTIGLVYRTYENGYVYRFVATADSTLFLLMCNIYIYQSYMICMLKNS